MSRKKKEEINKEVTEEVMVETTEVTEEIPEDVELQTTFNEDGLDILVEEGEIENEYKD